MAERPVPQDVPGLQAEVARLDKVVRALVNRAERDMRERRTDFGWFESTILLEDEVRARTRELEAALAEKERVTRDLQRAKERLEQAMGQLVQTEKLAALGSLVAGVAHELNTPLGNSLTVASSLNCVIDAFAEQFAAGNLRRQALLDFIEQCREAAGLIEKNCRRAAELIGNFKQVAVDQTSMRRRRFDLRQALEEVLSTLQPKLKHTHHELALDVPAGIEVDGFPGPLEQIVTNLVTNSLLHGLEASAAGHIRIAAEADAAGQVRLRYTDDGVGIPEHLAKRVFDPFFTTKLGSGGSGLGLYIVFNLATAVLGGTIELASRPGEGVRFDLRFPLVAPAPAANGAMQHAWQ